MHLVRQHRTEGEGRTMSGLPRATARSKPVLMVFVWLALLVAASLRFTMDTASVGRVDSRVIVGVSALVTGLLLVAVHWPARRSGSGARRLRPLEVVACACASAALLAGLPMLVFANRSSDAPPGSVVAFWTTVFFGGLLVIGGSVSVRPVWLRMASALLLVVSGAAVLANWERPSSFSLLVRYTGPQIMMSLAAVISVLLLLWLSARVERYGWSTSVGPIAGGAVLSGVLLLVSGRDSLDSLASPIVMLAAGASAVLYLMILSLGPSRGALLSGTAIAGVPAAITLLTVLESMVGMLGPRPVLLEPIIAACTAGGFAIVLILREYAAPTPRGPVQVPSVIAAAAVAAALVGMFAPALGVAVKGSLGTGEAFAVDFAMAGYETVAGWLAFAVTLVVLAALSSRVGRHPLVSVLATAVASAIAWIILRPMPLHTWVSWIPPEVQQDYGTEFASMVFSPRVAVWQGFGMALAFIAVAVASYTSSRLIGSTERTPSPLVEERT